MRKGIFGMLAATLGVALALVGCGGAGGAGSAADAKANFVGTWAVDAVTNDGSEVTGNELDLYKALGLYLTLGDDGTATFEMFGVEINGTWEAKDATTATLKLDSEDAEEADLDGEQNMTFADGKITMAAEDESITFVQIDPSEKTSSDLGSLLGEGFESLGDALGTDDTDDSSPLSDSQALDITVADDDVCTIKVTEVGDYYGDPGYLVSVTNKGDTQIEVEDDNEFTVGDKVVSPVFSAIVDPGETEDEILWFENSELDDGGVDALVNVEGKIIVTNWDTDEELATYDFAA